MGTQKFPNQEKYFLDIKNFPQTHFLAFEDQQQEKNSSHNHQHSLTCHAPFHGNKQTTVEKSIQPSFNNFFLKPWQISMSISQEHVMIYD